jgi:hypothetical protein
MRRFGSGEHLRSAAVADAASFRSTAAGACSNDGAFFVDVVVVVVVVVWWWWWWEKRKIPVLRRSRRKSFASWKREHQHAQLDFFCV